MNHFQAGTPLHLSINSYLPVLTATKEIWLESSDHHRCLILFAHLYCISIWEQQEYTSSKLKSQHSGSTPHLKPISSSPYA